MKQIWKQVKINDKNFSKVHFLKIPTVQLLLIFFGIIVCSGFVACGGNDNNEDTFKTLDDSDYADHSNVVVTRTASQNIRQT